MDLARGAIAAVIVIIIVVGLYYGLNPSKTSQEEGGTSKSYVIRAATLQGGISTLDLIEKDNLLGKRGYQLKVLRLQKTPNILEALEKNDTDLAVIPAEMAAKLIEKGQDLQIVAVDMLQNQAVLVNNNSGINSPADLEGRLIGAVLPSGTYKLFKAYMKVVYNITVVEGDSPSPGVITAVNVPPGSILDSLESRQVDAVVIWEPFVSMGLSRGMKILVSYQDLWAEANMSGDPVMLVWVARGDFVRNHEDALIAFLAARAEAASIWNNDRGAVLSMLSSLYRIDDNVGNILYERTVIVEGNLTENLVSAIKNEWWLAWQGGYLEQDPRQIPETVFYMP